MGVKSEKWICTLRNCRCARLGACGREENLNFIKNLLKISDLRPGGGGKGEEKGLKEGIDLRAN